MMHKPTTVMVVLFAAAMLSGTVNAEFQYRSTGAPVMEPPPAPKWDGGKAEFEATRKQFASAYAGAGQPRIALFWNTVFSEEFSDEKVSRTNIQHGSESSHSSLEKTTSGSAGSATLRDGGERNSSSLTITKGDVVTNKDKRRTPLAESDAWKLETAFATAMRTANVRFIDRNTIIRMTHVNQSKNGTNDSRAIESKALLGKADLFMEVLMARDGQAPLGWGFRVTLKDVKSGEQLAAFYSSAVPDVGPAPEPYYVATNKGYEKVTPEVTATVEDIGRALAVDTMRDLQQAFPAKGRSR